MSQTHEDRVQSQGLQVSSPQATTPKKPDEEQTKIIYSYDELKRLEHSTAVMSSTVDANASSNDAGLATEPKIIYSYAEIKSFSGVREDCPGGLLDKILCSQFLLIHICVHLTAISSPEDKKVDFSVNKKQDASIEEIKKDGECAKQATAEWNKFTSAKTPSKEGPTNLAIHIFSKPCRLLPLFTS